MKELVNKILRITATVTLMLIAHLSDAQQSRDTVKSGRTNDSMVVVPRRSKDGLTVNPGKPAEGMTIMTDTGFIRQNIMDNLLEIELARDGEKRGSTAEVKKLAAQMLTDHTAILNAFRKVAAATNFRVSATNTSMSVMLSSSAVGKEFDATWASEMLTMHEAKIRELESFLSVTQNAALKTLIGVCLPRLRAHIEMLLKIPGAKMNKVPNTAIQ